MTTRIRLFREDFLTNDGRMVRNVTWGDSVPALLGPWSEDRLIGVVTDIQRGSGGWVTGVVDTEENLTGRAAEAIMDSLVDEVVHTEEGEALVISGARLRGVRFGTTPTWDGMVIP